MEEDHEHEITFGILDGDGTAGHRVGDRRLRTDRDALSDSTIGERNANLSSRAVAHGHARRSDQHAPATWPDHGLPHRHSRASRAYAASPD